MPAPTAESMIAHAAARFGSAACICAIVAFAAVSDDHWTIGFGAAIASTVFITSAFVLWAIVILRAVRQRRRPPTVR